MRHTAVPLSDYRPCLRAATNQRPGTYPPPLLALATPVLRRPLHLHAKHPRTKPCLEPSALTLALSAPVDGVLELFAFPSGDDPEDAAGRSALGARVFEYVEAAPGSGPLGAAAVDGVEPTWDADHWRAWLADLVR